MSAQRQAFEAWWSDTYGDRFVDESPGKMAWNGWQAALSQQAPVSAEAGELPPLPQPAQESYVVDSVMHKLTVNSFNASQMRDYARAAIAKSRAQQVVTAEPIAFDDAQHRVYEIIGEWMPDAVTAVARDAAASIIHYCRDVFAQSRAQVVPPSPQTIVESFVAFRDRCSHYAGLRKDHRAQCRHPDSAIDGWCSMRNCPLLREQADEQGVS